MTEKIDLANSSSPSQRSYSPNIILSAVAIGFTLLAFLIALNCQVPSWGTWDLYASLLAGGARLYSDLHLPQQPLFFLYSEWWRPVAGRSWILSLIPPTILILLFSNAYFQLAKRSAWSDWQKSLVFLGASATAIAWAGYSFSDYRAITDIAALYVTILLLRLDEKDDLEPPTAWQLIALGCLCGISFTTRANDGILLFIATAAIMTTRTMHCVRNVGILAASALATVLGVIATTGDSFSSYFEYSLHSAAAMKGGANHVILTPILLIYDVARQLQKPVIILLIITFILMSAFPSAALRFFERSRPSTQRDINFLLVSIFLIQTLFLLIFYVYCDWFLHAFPYFVIPNATLPALIVLLLTLATVSALRVLRILQGTDLRNLLVLIPAGGLVAGAMSSGGDHTGLFGPIGLLLVLLPLISSRFLTGWKKEIALGAYGLFAVTICVGKTLDPLDWQFYRAKPMFVDRMMVDSPVHGRMLVEREMDSFFAPVCDTVKASGPGQGMLSLPYSYANYYCGIPPWRGYVQTYFDTSSTATIDSLIQRMAKSPPTWVVYQRQLGLLQASERAFNHGQPIRHRALDQVIWGHIQRGEWTIVRHWSDHPGNDWYFIRTSPSGWTAQKSGSLK